MDVAFASNGSGGGGFAAFIPLILLGIIPAFLFKSIAVRKGRSQWLWFLVGFVPVWGWVSGIWLASLPDKSVIEEVGNLVTELQKFNFTPKEGVQPSSPSETQSWKCNCGNINDISTPNCPECGLKRDFLLKRKES